MSVTRQDILRGLRVLGVTAGDVVLAHSSLSAFGHVEGAADAVADALLDAVGDAGTVVMPTFTWGTFHDRTGVVFDIAHTPCETGIVPDTFRQRPGVVRSAHLCHSVAALGPHARDVLGEGVSACGEGSTFDQLHELDAWNLFLGVGLEVCTALHAAEERMQVPYRRYRDFRESTVVWPDGRRTPSRAVEFLREPGARNDFARMRGVLEREGLLRATRVGEAEILNVRIRGVIDVAVRCLETDIRFLLAEGTP